MSWFTQESLELNPNWWNESIFLVSIKLKIESNISFPIIFRKLVIKTPVAKFLLIAYLLFLLPGTILPFSQISGKCSGAKEYSKSNINGLHIERAHSLNIFPNILSCIWAIFGSKYLISSRITSEEKLFCHELSN